MRDYEAILSTHAGENLFVVLKALEGEGCTGSVSVTEGANTGVVFLENGEVVDALVNDGAWVGEGICAVAFLANLPRPHFAYSAMTAFGKRTIPFDSARLQVLVEQARPLLLPPRPAEAESSSPAKRSAKGKVKHAPPTGIDPEGSLTGTPFEVFIEQLEAETTGDAGRGDERRTGRRPSADVGAPPPRTKAERRTSGTETTARAQEASTMALETYLQELKGINGYLAAGIMTFTGEMLVSDTADPKIDLGMVGAMFNDIFRTAHEASKKIGLQACKETVITTPLGTIVMRCSGVDAKAHVHIVSILKADGNQALMKMQIDKMVPAIIDELG